MELGYTLMGEEHGPHELVGIARRAEEAGFSFLAASDHFHPWVPEQRHSPFVWSVLGAVAMATEHAELATMVTCPTVRYHPAVVAQQAATIGVMSGGRFTLGLGAGERLNEHVVGRGWPPVDVRHEMLEEAVEIIRRLWDGGYHSYRGQHFTLEDARIFDLPERPVPIAVAASGPRSADLAARLGDAMIAVEPDASLVQRFHHGSDGGRGASKQVWGQQLLCWGADAGEAARRAHQHVRWATLGWKVMSELPNPVNFDWASRAVTPEGVAEQIPCGPDPQAFVDAVRAYADAGFDRLALCQVGPDQEGFFRFWERELAPALAELMQPATAAS